MSPDTVLTRWRLRWRSPASWTALLPLPGADEDPVRVRLKALDPAFIAALSRVDGVHFFRLVVVPPVVSAGQGVRLLLNVVHDGMPAGHLSALCDAVGPLLLEAMAEAKVPGGLAGLPEYLHRHRVKENTFFIGAVGKTVLEIRREQEVRERLEELVDRQDVTGEAARFATIEARRQALRAELALRFPGPHGRSGDPMAAVGRGLDLLLTFLFFPIIGVLGRDLAETVNRTKGRVRRALAWILCGVWWVYGALFTGLAMALVRVLEWIETDVEAPLPDEEQLARLENAEDRIPRNELTVWFPVRNTWIGRRLLAVILFGSERGVRHFWTQGRLAGAENIHYARLLQVDKGRHLIFMSDYEGAFDRYIDHFVGVGGHSRAVVPISSRLEGCPKTRWLYLQEDPPRFRRRWRNLIRLHQLKAIVWYSAYPFLSANEILANARLWDGLWAERLDEEDARAWARLL
ncbi:MAG: hypothetical protein ACYDC1_01265 [Limisphaerales bacterium]